MKRKIATVAAVSSLALSPIATAAGNGGSNWNATHLPSPAPGYLPKQYPAPADVSAWDAQHLPSPAPGYLPRTTAQPVTVIRLTSDGFRFHDAAIGAAAGALGVAFLGGAVLVATRNRAVRVGG
jgi:hypothetical protein